jgi:hypothetical protein
VDGTDSGSYPMMGFDTNSIESTSSSTRVLVFIFILITEIHLAFTDYPKKKHLMKLTHHKLINIIIEHTVPDQVIDSI